MVPTDPPGFWGVDFGDPTVPKRKSVFKINSFEILSNSNCTLVNGNGGVKSEKHL